MNDERATARLIFIGGAPRSGTTVVQNMLDCHPDVLGGPEFLHIPDIIQLRNKLHDSVSRDWISLICSHEEVDARIRALIADFLLSFADKHGAKRLSEKTPENVLVFPELVELFPGSRFIHVVRDPRATVASLLSVGEKAREKGETPAPFAADARSAIQYVRKCLDAGFKAAQMSPDTVYTAVYENLVRDPETEGHKICQFLGISWDPAMTRPGEKQHLGEAAITVNSKEIWYDADTYYSNPNTKSVDKWRSTLTPSQQIEIHREFRASAELKRLGYDLSVAQMSKTSLAQGVVAYGLARLRRAVGRRWRRLVRATT